MSVAVQFAEPAAFVVHAFGDVTFQEAMQAKADLLAHPGLGRHATVLIDGRDVTSAPTTTELRTIAREMKPLRERGVGHLAIVTRDNFVYGVARMFGLFAQPIIDVATFRDVDEAQRWLTSAKN